MASVKTSPFVRASKVGTTTSIAPSELNTFHLNPRRGDVTAIAGSLRTNDQYKPITVNVGTFTGRPNEVLAGNHTLMAFRDLGEKHPDDPRWEEILVHWVDVDDDKAKRIVAADNRTSELGTNDAQALADLLNGLGDLEGTGYASTDLNDLMEQLGQANAEGAEADSMPEYSTKTDIPHYTPSDEPPTLDQIIDHTKTDQLVAEINAADIPDDVAAFLIQAAQRHTVIHFTKAADFYASATPEVQRLMESQLLVLVDFDNAIQNGYVQLTESLRTTLGLDMADDEDAA